MARSQRNRRTQFLFLYSYCVQLAFMFWLSKTDAQVAVVPKVGKPAR